MRHKDYVDLFEGLVERHVELSDFAMVQIEPNSVFDSIDLSDYKDAKKTINPPFLILQAEDYNYSHSYSQDKRYVQGAFIVADKVNSRSDKVAVREGALKLSEEVLSYLKQKVNVEKVLGRDVRFLVERVKSEYVGPFDNFLGVRVLFAFEDYVNANLKFDNKNWK